MVVNVVVVFLLTAGASSGVFYHLNETEYERMPPLFGMDTNYRSCLMQSGGVYCVAKFELHGDPYNELIHIIRKYSQHEIKHYNHSIIDRAVCVTQSCKKFIQDKTLNEEADLNIALEGCVNETIWTKYGLEARLADVLYCDKHGDQMPIDVTDWILGGILISLLAMNLIGTVYDVYYLKKLNNIKNRTGNPYLLNFSIRRNWNILSDTRTRTNVIYERISGIHGLRSITTFFIALAHVMWLVGIGYTDNPRDLEMSYEYRQYQLIFGGMVIVQIFFVISGCLLTFHLQVLSEDKAHTWKNVPKILFFRWARLTPANAIVVLFTATWLRHLGSGPLWKLFAMNVATDCRRCWWKHLIYLNNYISGNKYCAIQTWHLAAEMQLFTVGLIVYRLTARRGRYTALAVLALAGVVAPALHVWLQDLDALVMFKPEFYRVFDNDTFHSMHILGHNNVSCYAIGMTVGLLSYYCIKHSIEYTNHKILKFITWCVPLGIVGLFLSGSFFYIDGDRPHVSLRMAYAAVQRPALGVMTAILLLNLVLKFENRIRHVLEWRGWVFTSRLCYGVYLLHVNLIHVLMGTRTQLGHVSFLHVIVHHFGVVSLTFAVSVPFYLMIEAPLTATVKEYLDASQTKQKKVK